MSMLIDSDTFKRLVVMPSSGEETDGNLVEYVLGDLVLGRIVSDAAGNTYSITGTCLQLIAAGVVVPYTK